MRPLSLSSAPTAAGSRLRVATYNIHKGVRGIGPLRRLEIHNLSQAVETLDADLVFLQEVQHVHRAEARRFGRGAGGWPQEGQAEFLAPEGYDAVYRSNAVTRHGEHGNALLSRWPLGEPNHRDVSDHRFEQRGLLHVPVRWAGLTLEAVVVHFGLSHASRVRQVQRLLQFIEREVDPAAPLLVAGDFNDWGERLDPSLRAAGLSRAVAPMLVQGGEGSPGSQGGPDTRPPLGLTFPSLAPLFALDRIYTRGLGCASVFVPRGSHWARMSDHLPLVAEFERPVAAP